MYNLGFPLKIYAIKYSYYYVHFRLRCIKMNNIHINMNKALIWITYTNTWIKHIRKHKRLRCIKKSIRCTLTLINLYEYWKYFSKFYFLHFKKKEYFSNVF